MAVNDLAGSSVYGPTSIEQLYAGEADIHTDAAPALAAIAKYEICALTATGVTPFLVGTHTAPQAVVAMQPAAITKQCPYATGGYFNHAVLIWPAGATLDTYAERKAWLVNSTLKIGHITPSVGSSQA